MRPPEKPARPPTAPGYPLPLPLRDTKMRRAKMPTPARDSLAAAPSGLEIKLPVSRTSSMPRSAWHFIRYELDRKATAASVAKSKLRGPLGLARPRGVEPLLQD